MVKIESLTGIDAWEDTEYLPTSQRLAPWGGISCEECCNHISIATPCSKAWKITIDNGIRKCYFYKKKFEEFLTKEDFDV